MNLRKKVWYDRMVDNFWCQDNLKLQEKGYRVTKPNQPTIEPIPTSYVWIQAKMPGAEPTLFLADLNGHSSMVFPPSLQEEWTQTLLPTSRMRGKLASNMSMCTSSLVQNVARLPQSRWMTWVGLGTCLAPNLHIMWSIYTFIRFE